MAETVHCAWCNGDVDADAGPCPLSFECPTCLAPRGQQCMRPSGHSGPFVETHVARRDLEYAAKAERAQNRALRPAPETKTLRLFEPPAALQPPTNEGDPPMTVQEQERLNNRRLRALAKARRVRTHNAERRHRAEDAARAQFGKWLQRERLAFTLHAADPSNVQLLNAWRKTLRERPALYGRREANAA